MLQANGTAAMARRRPRVHGEDGRSRQIRHTPMTSSTAAMRAYFACNHGRAAVAMPSSKARHARAGAAVPAPARSPSPTSRMATVAAAITANAAGTSG